MLWGLISTLCSVHAAPHKKLTTPNPINFFSASTEKIVSAQDAAYNSVPATSQLLFVCVLLQASAPAVTASKGASPQYYKREVLHVAD